MSDEEIIERLWFALWRTQPVERAAFAQDLFGRSGLDVLRYLSDKYGPAKEADRRGDLPHRPGDLSREP